MTCDGVAWTGAAATHKVFPEMYVPIMSELRRILTETGVQRYIYSIKRAYGLPFFDPFDLCTFPVGEEGTPYYKCHSGELFEVRFFLIPRVL